MNEEELKAWKAAKKAEAYEEYQKDPIFVLSIRAYEARLKAIDQI